MKKISAIILCMLLAMSSYSQIFITTGDDPREKMRLAIRAGLNFSSLYDTKGENFSSDSRTGLMAGVFLSVPISTYLGFQPEFNYSQKGFSGNGSILVLNYSYKRKLDFLDIPLLLQIKPAPFLTLVVGPQFSFLLHKGYDFSSGTIDITQQTDIENNNIRKNTLGAVAGVDIIMLHFVISGRLAWDLQRNNGDGTSTSPRYRMMVAQISAGIIF